MADFQEEILELINTALERDFSLNKIETPPEKSFGDYAFPCFSLMDKFDNPHEAAKKTAEVIRQKDNPLIKKVSVKGGYLNFFLNTEVAAEKVLKEPREKEGYGSEENQDQTVLIESPGPNTNKPLHLGHLRNIVLSQSVKRIKEFTGKTPVIVNIVNDRGIHICKSMLAYKRLGGGKTPESEGKKPDHFVGEYYVKYSELEEENPEVEEEVREMLVKWEEGDEKIRQLGRKMNNWALEGFRESYERINFEVEKEYFESETYEKGKEIVLSNVPNVFEENKEGAVVIDLEDEGLGEKVILRPDSTSLYITQDLYLAKKRYEDFSFDKMIYVVANEQDYHFKVLFKTLERLGFEFVKDCFHLSYGLVELPEGRMKSRKGKVVDMDDLLDESIQLAEDSVKEKHNSLGEEEVERRAKKIGLGAIRFFFLKHGAKKNFLYQPRKALRLEGDTGPYCQYAYTRASSILRKAEEEVDGEERDLKLNPQKINFSLLSEEKEKEVVKQISIFERTVAEADERLDPSIITDYLLELAKRFTEFYHACPVLEEDQELRKARLLLTKKSAKTLKQGLELLGIDTLEKM